MHSVPQRCAGRPLAGGLVVPHVSLIHNGHAVFGSLDADRALAAFLQRLCQICGQRLTERCYLIVRPADEERGCSPEPALHPECLPYTAQHCPMLNGTAVRYRSSPILATHPAGRSCNDPSCPCPARTPDKGSQARRGRPADRYEAWMIHTRRYQLVPHQDEPDLPSGISLHVPILRKRLLRRAALPPSHEALLNLLRDALSLDD
ncbi:cell envelope biogenesis protein OmpA [Streptomyces sp. NPDC094468]|uniref:cell envelope biogenesis protein OmpA n=1 Tax=Streptomyces sp. NPDC094468 TaxID=3366066 RepID=UPI003827352E